MSRLNLRFCLSNCPEDFEVFSPLDLLHFQPIKYFSICHRLVTFYLEGSSDVLVTFCLTSLNNVFRTVLGIDLRFCRLTAGSDRNTDSLKGSILHLFFLFHRSERSGRGARNRIFKVGYASLITAKHDTAYTHLGGSRVLSRRKWRHYRFI